MTTQAPIRNRWKAIHRAARVKAGIGAKSYPADHGARAAEALADLGFARPPVHLAVLAALLHCAAQARRSSAPQGARVWLSLAHARNFTGA